MATSSDNIKAGIFVITGLILAVAIVVTLADLDRFFEQRREVTVRYSLGDGIGGLAVGAEVRLGDQPVGNVTRIEDITKDGSQVVIAKRITFSIPDRYAIHKNAVIELQEPFIGSGAALNIRSVGSGELYEAGADIEGGLMPSALASQFVEDLGIGFKQQQEIKQIIENVASITKKVDTALDEDYPRLRDDIFEVMDNVKPATKDARESLAHVKDTTAEVREFVFEFRERSGLWMDRFDSITASADSSLKTVDKLVTDKDPTVRKTLDNVEAISQRARDETMDQIKKALDKADAALENARVATGELKTFVHTNSPVLERAMANFQLTAAQLKLASIEVRRSPWRLLYSPKDKEIANDNLYDAARSFALAASAIDSATAGLEHIVQNEPENKEAIQERVEYLERLFGRFEEAEKRFWQKLQESKGE